MGLRTIDQCIAERRQKDPGDALTAWALRQLVKSGQVPVLMIGKKQLVSTEVVEAFVASQFETEGI